MRTQWLVLLLSIVTVSVCSAQERCPWLNAATAGGVLGGEVTDVTLKLSKSGDSGSCLFTRAEGTVWRRLLVEVGSDEAKCEAPKTSLKAIGNEAVACSYKGNPGETAEQVTGRVRTQAFLVRMSTSKPDASSAALRESARKIAEQIAGFLF